MAPRLTAGCQGLCAGAEKKLSSSSLSSSTGKKKKAIVVVQALDVFGVYWDFIGLLGFRFFYELV